METYFAAPERTGREELSDEIDFMGNNPVMSMLLQSVSGLLAILDEHRQIVSVNDSLLKALGIEDAAQVLGLRPGEALDCVHAYEDPAGCGTTKFCSTCGAAISIVSSLETDEPVERLCALSSNKGGKTVDLAMLVKSHPMRIDGKRFLLLFLRDITLEQQRAALEKTFFHDIGSLLTVLLWTSETFLEECPSDLSETLHHTALKLHQEIAIQRALLKSDHYDYQPMRRNIAPAQVFAELESFFANHPAAQKRSLKFQEHTPDVEIYTDISLLSRVLNNMIINAFEATAERGHVKIWAERTGRDLSFCVWNQQIIPENIAHRIFQRNFSTKNQAGRGIGTFSMKLFGEKVLGGEVTFRSSETEGTVFKLSLPL